MKFRKNAGEVSNTQNKIQLFPILLINFIGTLGFSIVLPFLVFLVKDFGGNPISSNLGFIVGPALAAILGSTIFGNILPVLAALILSLVTLIVIAVALKEFRSPSGVVLVPEKGTIRKVFAQECKECYEVEDPKRKLRFKDVFKLKQISFLLMLYFFIFLGFNIFYATFPIQAVNGLKWSITQLGIFYAVLSGMMVLVEGPVLRKALKKYSEEKLVVIGSLILGANFILLVSNQAILVYCAAVLFALGNGLMWPSVISLLSKRAGIIH
jgi:MFS transporter, DHA1 family, tetracycline resistance protein